MKLLRAQQGAVTVYMLLVIVPLFMLAALLIDLARIKLAAQESETALKAGIRSVMSRYDRSLHQVGLWGLTVNRDAAERELSEIMSANLSDGLSGGLRFIDTSLQDGRVRLTPVYSLASQLVLRKQLLEAMKWEAPIAWKRYVTDVLRPAETAAPLADGVILGRLAEELDKLLAKRDAALDEASAKVGELYQMWRGDVEQVRQQTALLPQAAAPSAERAALYLMHARVRETATRGLARQQELQQQTAHLLERAQLADERLQADLAAAREQTVRSTLPAARMLDAVPLYGAAYFQQEQEDIGSLVARFAADCAYLDTFEPERLPRVEMLFAELAKDGARWYAERAQVALARRQQLNNIEDRQRHLQERIQAVFEQTRRQAVPTLCAAADGSAEDAYRLLQRADPLEPQGLYQKYRSLNGEDPVIGGLAASELDKPEAVSLGALRLLDSLLAAAEAEPGDDVWVDEFVLTAFSSRTTQAAPPSGRLFGQEAEYVLYGFSGCGLNLSAAYADMFLLRLAVRTVEAFLKPDPASLQAGSPMLAVLAAAAEGSQRAAGDMQQLAAGKAIEFFGQNPSGSVQLDYGDYLRMCLLVHSSQTKTLARIQALLELNTGLDLRYAATYVEAHAESSVRLWFLPALARLSYGSRLLGCEVRGEVRDHRCTMSSTAVWAY